MRDHLVSPVYLYSAKEDDLQIQFMPDKDERDQIFTFLICESFSFDFQENAAEILSCYKSGEVKYPICLQHNMILSLKDGLITYFFAKGNVLYQFPLKITQIAEVEPGEKVGYQDLVGKPMVNRFVQPQQKSFEHIRHFAKMLHQGLCMASVFFPDMGEYIQSKEDVLFLDIYPEV